jgi:excisionase family DNA binding protein
VTRQRHSDDPDAVLAVEAQSLSPSTGLTPNEVARLLRVGPDRVRAWIARGELQAINTATTRCGRPRYVILPGHLEEFVRSRRAGPPPKPQRRRRGRRPAGWVDYLPD